MTCIDCKCVLERGECSPCLSCEIDRNKTREAAGAGEKWCRDCHSAFAAVTYDEDDNAIVHAECPECDSDAVEPLSVAQHRAELAMERGL